MPLVTTTPIDQTELRIVNDIVAGLRNTLGTLVKVYPALFPQYIEGSMGNRCIQVCPGQTVPFGEGDGGQMGGSRIKRKVITLALWYRLKEDMHQRSDQMLTEDTFGFLSWMSQIEEILGLTKLSLVEEGSIYQILYAPLLWLGHSDVKWYDEDNGWANATITYAADFATSMPHVETLSPAQCLPLVNG